MNTENDCDIVGGIPSVGIVGRLDFSSESQQIWHSHLVEFENEE